MPAAGSVKLPDGSWLLVSGEVKPPGGAKDRAASPVSAVRSAESGPPPGLPPPLGARGPGFVPLSAGVGTRGVPVGGVKDKRSLAVKWQQRRKEWWYPAGVERMVRRYVRRIFGALAVYLVLPWIVPGLGSFAAVAALAGDTSSALGTVLHSGANLTRAASVWLEAASDNALASTSALWHGIDLVNIAVGLQRGNVATDDLEALLQAVAGPKGNRLVQAHIDFRLKLVDTLRELPPRTPRAHFTWDLIRLSSRWEFLMVQVAAGSNGLTALGWATANVSFQAQWVNPLWDLLAVPPERQEADLALRLKALLFHLEVYRAPFLSEDLLSSPDVPIVFFSRAAWAYRQAARASFWFSNWAAGVRSSLVGMG